MKFHLVRFFFPNLWDRSSIVQELSSSVYRTISAIRPAEEDAQSETMGAVLHARGAPGGLLDVVPCNEYLIAFGAPQKHISDLASSRRNALVCCETTLQWETKRGKWVLRRVPQECTPGWLKCCCRHSLLQEDLPPYSWAPFRESNFMNGKL